MDRSSLLGRCLRVDPGSDQYSGGLPGAELGTITKKLLHENSVLHDSQAAVGNKRRPGEGDVRSAHGGQHAVRVGVHGARRGDLHPTRTALLRPRRPPQPVRHPRRHLIAVPLLKVVLVRQRHGPPKIPRRRIPLRRRALRPPRPRHHVRSRGVAVPDLNQPHKPVPEPSRHPRDQAARVRVGQLRVQVPGCTGISPTRRLLAPGGPGPQRHPRQQTDPCVHRAQR
mmetsp:Transcript_89120/g.238715  ORF Transcript_89120/g.238715 Transcript_89120/m.238715 type:complete len:226 (-) Transcript_89120:968-1645(-)